MFPLVVGLIAEFLSPLPLVDLIRIVIPSIMFRQEGSGRVDTHIQGSLPFVYPRNSAIFAEEKELTSDIFSEGTSRGGLIYISSKVPHNKVQGCKCEC